MAFWQWGDAQAKHVILCVHGLTRQGRDFDALAQALLADAARRGRPPLRIVCPDVPGRGQSEWLRDPALYQVPVYAGAMLQLLAHLHRQAPVARLDWVGTSMGGLIAFGVAVAQGTSAWPLPAPLHKLVLNDVGPAITWESIERIGSYVADTGHYASEQDGIDRLRERFVNFGPHSSAQWEALNRPMLRVLPDGGWTMHYDPAIAKVFGNVSREAFEQGSELLWQVYDALTVPTLLLRGADSDLLTRDAAHAMQQRGPCAQLVEFAGVGHAPTLVQPDQTAAVCRFLLEDDPA